MPYIESDDSFESYMSGHLIKSLYGIHIPHFGPTPKNVHIPALENSNGIICLINMYKHRPGSERDVAALIDMSQKLNFELFEEPANFSGLVKRTAHADLNQDEIFELVERFSKYKLKETRVPRILVLMCHGNEDGMQDGSGVFFNFHTTILHHFNSLKNPAFANFLKIFIVQACQGSRPIPEIDFDSDPQRRNQAYVFSNLLVGQSSMDGSKSLRIRTNGSPYIQNFCDIMLKSWNASNSSITDILNDLHIKVQKSGGTNFVLVPELKQKGALDKKYRKKSMYDICNDIKKMDQMRIILRKSVVNDVFNIASSDEKEKIKNFMYN